MGDYILVIDEGTTSTRAIVFDRDLNEVALAPRPGKSSQGCRPQFYEYSLPRATPHATAPPHRGAIWGHVGGLEPTLELCWAIFVG